MYVDVSYYQNDFKGTVEDVTSVEKALKTAEIKVNELSFGRIEAKGFKNLTDFQKKCVREAVCYQAEYYIDNGYDGTVQSYSVPDISVTVKTGDKETERNRVSPLTVSLLTQSGLNSRRI